MRHLWLLGILFFLVSEALAQDAGLFQIPDSLKVKDSVSTYTWEDATLRPAVDSIPGILSHHYRPFLKREIYGLDLGNNGSEVRPLKFEFDRSSGLRMGYDGFQIYRWEFLDLPYYKSSEAHTNLFASQGNSFANATNSSQDNAHFEAEFSKTFEHELNASVFYRKINEEGIYSRDASNHTQFAIRLSQSRSKGKLFWSAAYIRNVFNRQHNGGLDSLTFFEDDAFTVRSTIPIKFEDAGLRDEENIFALGLKWKLTSSKSRSGLFLENLISYGVRNYKYADQSIAEIDSLFAPWINHPFKLRHAWKNNNIQNDFAIRWSSELFPLIKVGVNFANHQLDDEVIKANLTYATLNGQLAFDVKDIFKINLESYLELLEEAGDFDLSGSMAFDWKKVGALEAQISLGLQSPVRVYEQFSINESPIYNQDLTPIQYFKVGGQLSILETGLKIHAHQYVLNDYYYRNRNLQVTSTDLTSITQLGLSSNIKLAFLAIYNEAIFQQADKEVFTVPSWFTRHIIAYQGNIFKNKMWIRAGVEGRFMNQDMYPYFLPMTGEFIPSDQTNSDVSYHVEPFFTTKISKFTFFIKAENLESIWESKPSLNATLYPSFDWMLRFGINWRYID